MRFSFAAKKIKNNNQEVYFLNPWEFLTYWEIKLLPADKTSVENLAKRGARASSKKEIQDCFVTFHAKIFKAIYINIYVCIHIKCNYGRITDCAMPHDAEVGAKLRTASK